MLDESTPSPAPRDDDAMRIRPIDAFAEGLRILSPYDKTGYGVKTGYYEVKCWVEGPVGAEDVAKLEALDWHNYDGDGQLWEKFT